MTSLDFSIAKEIPMDISRFASISLEKIDAIYFIITIHIISPDLLLIGGDWNMTGIFVHILGMSSSN